MVARMDESAEEPPAGGVGGTAEEAGPETVLEAPNTRSPAELAERFAGYARAARGTALQAKGKSDPYGERLANNRAEVYDKASNTVLRLPLDRAATEMMEQAGRTHVRTAPLMDFDNTGVQYICARAWQYCALEIDPNLKQQAPQWE